MSSLRVLIVLSCGLGLVSACVAHRAHQNRETDTLNSGHWVHEAQLRGIMSSLDRDRSTTWPQEIAEEYREDRERRLEPAFDELELYAGRLAVTAGRISDAVTDVEMTDVDRSSFLAQVETLKDQAQHLQMAAEGHDLTAVRATLASIDQTCNSCHERFREFAGPLRTRF